jgi:hypothetical protein
MVTAPYLEMRLPLQVRRGYQHCLKPHSQANPGIDGCCTLVVGDYLVWARRPTVQKLEERAMKYD